MAAERTLLQVLYEFKGQNPRRSPIVAAASLEAISMVHIMATLTRLE
jgi:hypothetical protein